MTNNCPSNETTWVPPHFICGDLFGFSSRTGNLPAENLTGSLLPATPEFNIPCSASSLQGDLTDHNLYVTTSASADCEFNRNPTTINQLNHYVANFGSVASNSNFYSPFASLTHRNEASLDPGSNYMQITSLLSCSTDQCSEKSGSNITQFTNVPNYNLYKGPLSPIHTSNMVKQQKYLHVMREILFNVVSYAVGDLSETDSTVWGLERELNVPSGSHICTEEMPISSCDDEVGFRALTVGRNSPDECDVVKANLVQMLKMVNSYFCPTISKLFWFLPAL